MAVNLGQTSNGIPARTVSTKALARDYSAAYVRTQDLLREHAEDHGADLPAERRAMQDYGRHCCVVASLKSVGA